MGDAVTKRVRTCIGCGGQSDKMALKRIVRKADGTVEYDATGRVAGRGAYVCSPECLAVATRAKKLQRALKTNVSQEDAERIVGQMLDAFADDDVR